VAEEASNLANYPGFAGPNKMRLNQYLRKRETQQEINEFNASRSVELGYPTFKE
jgi:hypothetical protein